MKRKSKAKKILIPIALVLVLALGAGIWFVAAPANADPVNVYPFNYLGMTEYWGDTRESYGPVTTDRIQTIYLSDTQTVTEILVSLGDTVQKGDLLMTFDTTLTDLALERERLNVEKLKLQLEDAQDYLKEIKAMKPMVIPTQDDKEDTNENLGTALNGPYQISAQSAYDGSTQEKSLICWINGSTAIDDALFEAIRQAAQAHQEKNAQNVPITGGEQAPVLNTNTETEAPSEPPTEIPTEAPSEAPTEAPTEPSEEPTAPSETPSEPTEPEVPAAVDTFHVIFKVTEGNMSLGTTTTWQGMKVTRNPANNTFTFQFFDASGIQDHMKAQLGADTTPKPEIDLGSGYTSAQLSQMRAEQEKTIKDLQFQIKMAEAEYKIMQTEVSDGKIYAQIDGEVVSLLSEDEAMMLGQPILKISGGGGFYVEGTVSELEKDDLQIGQEVTINDWNTGMTYVGTIESLGDFPSAEGYWNGMGNPNASYYPFTVYLDGSADLQEGNYVSIMYGAATAENGLYLENPFLRTEGGKSYVFLLGADGKLEKRYVTTGKSLWGSYTEILDGITAEDYIAFPYGKGIREGVPAVECEDLSELYGY